MVGSWGTSALAVSAPVGATVIRVGAGMGPILPAGPGRHRCGWRWCRRQGSRACRISGEG
ncbi:hypothetical protein [Ornithinimicrobium kibberense]|uniref:hypothetical protein n=1 Tax=Ornithinimicrobium kibberense TaxID=282060 RepID=UPI003622EA67